MLRNKGLRAASLLNHRLGNSREQSDIAADFWLQINTRYFVPALDHRADHFRRSKLYYPRLRRSPGGSNKSSC